MNERAASMSSGRPVARALDTVDSRAFTAAFALRDSSGPAASDNCARISSRFMPVVGRISGSVASASVAASTSAWAASASALLLRVSRPPEIPPKPPPSRSAPRAAWPYSPWASSSVRDRPACQRSRPCCAISCGTSKATPLPTPLAIPPANWIVPFSAASARTSPASCAALPPA